MKDVDGGCIIDHPCHNAMTHKSIFIREITKGDTESNWTKMGLQYLESQCRMKHTGPWEWPSEERRYIRIDHMLGASHSHKHFVSC